MSIARGGVEWAKCVTGNSDRGCFKYCQTPEQIDKMRV